jgi:hypothetical protein
MEGKNTRTSVVDPLHFGTDLYQQIRTTDLRIRQWLTRCQQQLSFSSKFFAYYFFEGTGTVHLHKFSWRKRQKEVTR